MKVKGSRDVPRWMMFVTSKQRFDASALAPAFGTVLCVVSMAAPPAGAAGPVWFAFILPLATTASVLLTFSPL